MARGVGVITMGSLGLPWPFDRGYMQLALAAGLAIGVTAPLVGTFLVQKRLSLMGDGIGHVAFAGVAAGLLLDVWPVWTALVVAVAGAVGMEWLRTHGRTPSDLALALVFYGGLAAGVVLINKADAGPAATGYLFGQLLTVDGGDVAVVVGIGVAIAVTLAVFGRALFAIVLDEESARVAGIPVDACNGLLAALTACTVVAAMRVVGVLLVAAMMVLPVASVRLLARSFRATVVGSAALGGAIVIGGLTAARAWDLAPGGSIVVLGSLVFLVTALAGPRRSQQTARTDG
jgi:zinc transport system permease protein